MKSIALKSSYKENIGNKLSENEIEKDYMIKLIKEQMEKEKLERENLEKQISGMKEQAQKDKILHYFELSQKVGNVAEYVEKYYVKIIKDLKEYFLLIMLFEIYI